MPASVLVTIIGSIGLIAIGLGFYFGTDTESITALIPAFIGTPLLLCGLAAIKPACLKLAMHIATPIALLGAVGTTRVFSKWSELTAAARTAQLAAFVIFTVMFVTYVLSFIKARKQPRTDAEAESG